MFGYKDSKKNNQKLTDQLLDLTNKIIAMDMRHSEEGEGEAGICSVFHAKAPLAERLDREQEKRDVDGHGHPRRRKDRDTSLAISHVFILEKDV